MVTIKAPKMVTNNLLAIFFLGAANCYDSHGGMYSKNGIANAPSDCSNDKLSSLDPFRVDMSEPGTILTTNQGVRISDNQNSLKAGIRGPTLLEDFILREKITHFDHERIPERVVHARGSAAFGEFQPYASFANITKAHFLQDPNIKTPVFTRFSTVVGFKGSADTVRDVRGFATKFYTQEGNFDIVGNNIPVFFIQDAIKFPDIIHAAKPEHDTGIPQASSAHDTFWDFVAEQTETIHMIMWVMSDRAIPKSYSTMEGFGVNTFRLVDAEGVSRFVKFHWKPLLGAHSLVWEEAQQLAGKDPDFNRRDLWDNIAAGNFFEYELGVQIIEEKDEHNFDFDILDATKLIPEELVPVQKLGKLTLNRNPEYFFAETEQVAYCTANIVPGVDFSDDPLMQGRIFSYLDTQITRLGGPNFQEIPINRPVCPFNPRNNQRDGFHRMTINVGKANYDINSINNGLPREAGPGQGFETYPEKVSGRKVRGRSPLFLEHFAQATLFWKSQSDWEQDHIVDAFAFELAKVTRVQIREKVLGHLQAVSTELAERVAVKLGLKLGPNPHPGYPREVTPSPALSLENQPRESVKGRKVAILAANGFDQKDADNMRQVLEKEGAFVRIVFLNPQPEPPALSGGLSKLVHGTLQTFTSVFFDAVYIPGGGGVLKQLLQDGRAIHFVQAAFVHYKPIAASGEGEEFLKGIGLVREAEAPEGILLEPKNYPPKGFFRTFRDYVAMHRFYNRDVSGIPA